jgi:hypothetical protein
MEVDFAPNLKFGTLEPPMKRKPIVVCKEVEYLATRVGKVD